MRTGDPPPHHDTESAALDLPPNVTLAMWAEERRSGQNPRIRSYLGCTRMIEEVLDSNYSLLNCSPDRLRKIWKQVRETCDALRSDLARTLSVRSSIPELESARANAERAYHELETTLLADIDKFAERFPADQLPEVRQLLCKAIGRIYAFLRDSFGEVMAADPRSRHEADYFLSKRFAQDIEASEWLYSSVYEMCDYLDGLERVASSTLDELTRELERSRMIPPAETWEPNERVLVTLRDELGAKLRELMSLRAIRAADLQALDGFATKISHQTNNLLALCSLGREVVENVKSASGSTVEQREQSVRDILCCHETISARMAGSARTVSALMTDLRDYVPAWLSRIEQRRALMWSKAPDERDASNVSEFANPDYFRRRFDD